MPNLPQHVLKYLQKFSNDKWIIKTSNDILFEMIIVIPAIKEFENKKKLLQSLIKNDSTYFSKILILFVINNLESAPTEIKKSNGLTLDLLERIITDSPLDEFEENVVLSGLNIGYVNCSSPGFELPQKDGGVGLARKIGMDNALKRYDYSSDKKNILVCLDADCTVEKNYLNSIYEEFNKSDLSAGYVNFQHPLPENEEEKKAIIAYEIFMFYYVLALRYAKSSYAFFTIGSTMFCDAESYIKIGGMNKKKAAEDFYFMEKLSKVTSIEKIDGSTVYPSPRGSWRVPFGTGQRVNRFLSKTQNEYLLYNPASFKILKKWIKLFYESGTNISSIQILEKSDLICSPLKQFLQENSFQKNWENIIRNSKSIEQLQKQKAFWFDGFKTLKLLHYLRDNGYPLVNTFSAVDQLLELISNPYKKINNTDDIPSIEMQIEYLNILRKIA